MTLYTQIAYNDLCGCEYKEPEYRMERGVLVEYRCDAYGAMRRNRLITTNLSDYLKLDLEI